MMVVISILVLLLAAGVRLLGGNASQSRTAGTDLLEGMIEQARSSAITSRSYMVLAVAEPQNLMTGDSGCQLGLFRVTSWPDSNTEPLQGVLIGRWRALQSGIALIGGEVAGADNPMDSKELTIVYGNPKEQTIQVHAIAFNPRGALHYPPGSAPVVLRIAEGDYRSGMPVARRRGESGTITENRLKIGRVTSRPYQTDE